MDRHIQILTDISLSKLADALAAELRASTTGPWSRDVIMVESPGMRRWLTLALAERLGCVGGLRLQAPGIFFHQWTSRLAEEQSEPEAPFHRGVLAWRLYDLLDDSGDDPVLSPLRWYLKGGDAQVRARKRFQLADRIAGIFDDYQVARHDWLRWWERDAVGPLLTNLQPKPIEQDDADAAWQRALWRRLVVETPDHLAGRLGRLHQSLLNGNLPPDTPDHLFVFAPSRLPVLFLELLKALAAHRTVTLYLVTPTPAYFGDRRRKGEFGANPDLNTNGSLIAVWSRQSRIFIDTVLEYGEPMAQGEFEVAPEDTLLHALQADVIAVDPPMVTRRLDPHDNSLTIHSCHGPLREMEVARDQVLAAFDEIPGLRPTDVLLLVPDLEAYAPLAQAVFEHGGVPRLPLRVAERHLTEEPLVEAFLHLLKLPESRLGASELLDLLESEAVRAAAGLDENDMTAVRGWIDALPIRWGVDADSRAKRFDIPSYDAGTWRAGMDRLLLGYAMGDTGDFVGERLPYDDLDSSDSEALGRWLGWMDRLFMQIEILREPRTLGEWAPVLRDAAGALLLQTGASEDERDSDAFQALQKVVGKYETMAVAGQARTTVPLAVLRDHLAAQLEQTLFGPPTLGGGITVATYHALRHIPCRVLITCGLDTSFPRSTRPLGFDLQARYPRDTDRKTRDDDRQLMLDWMMSARERWILTYVGRGAADNKERAASVCVEELRDAIRRGWTTDHDTPADQAIVIDHPLQPFAPRYFGASTPRLFSFAAERCLCARMDKQALPAPFVPDDFDIQPKPPVAIRLDDLVRFWQNPAEHFARHALGLYLKDVNNDIEDEEMLESDPLSKYKVLDFLCHVPHDHAGDLTWQRDVLSEKCMLPPLAQGDASFHQHHEAATETLQRLGDAKRLEPLPVHLDGDGWSLDGMLGNLTSAERLILRTGSVRTKDRLGLWVHHVVLNVIATRHETHGQLPRTSRIVSTSSDKDITLAALADADDFLSHLIAGYCKGMRRPLPFMAEGARAAGQILGKDKSDTTGAIHKARAQWDSSLYKRGDSADASVALLWRGRDLYATHSRAFLDWTARIVLPLLAAEGNA